MITNPIDPEHIIVSKSFIIDWDEFLFNKTHKPENYTENLTDNPDIEELVKQLNKSEGS